MANNTNATNNMFTSKNIIGFTTAPESLPGKLKNLKKRFSQQKDNVTTMYATNKTASLSADLSFVTLARMCLGLETGKEVFIGKTKTGYVTELKSTDKITQIAVVTQSKNGLEISACELNTETGVSFPYNKEGTRKGTLIKVAMIPIFQQDEEFRNEWENILNFSQTSPDDPIWDNDPDMLERFGKSLTVASNNAYYRTVYDGTCGNAGIFFSGISVLRQNDLKKVKVSANIYGKSDRFECENNNAASSVKGKDLVGKYSILTRGLTDAEKKLVPVMDDWYITPQWVEAEAQIVQASKIFPIPFRSILLYGVSGTGKTEGARAIFSALGLPAVSICCSVDMTMFDFFGQMIPNVRKYGSKSTDEVSAKLGIPSFDDVENDFEGTYKQIFGTAPDALASPSDCYQKITEMMMASKSDGEADFIYSESAFVKAYRNGWGLEIQEPTIIKRNSVLAGLNQALDNDPKAASITLPTGEVVKRHPDFCVIMTTNQDYDGCNNIQQSVLSRMQNKRHIANPTVEELVSRTMAETKFPDKNVLSTMANIIKEMNEFCNKADVTDGVCGPRELSNWAKRAYIEAIIGEGTDKIKTIGNEYVIRAAFPTVIEKVSQVSEDREQAIIEVIQKHFAEGDVMVARDEYMEGVA